MTKKMKIGLRELARNTKLIDEYDYLEIEDKKTHTPKGIYVSEKYSEFIKNHIEAEKQKRIQEHLEIIEKFAGKFEMEDRFKGLSGVALKEEVAKAKCGM